MSHQDRLMGKAAYMELPPDSLHVQDKRGTNLGGGPGKLALLVLLGFACPIAPAGHQVMSLEMNPEEKMSKSLFEQPHEAIFSNGNGVK